MPLLLETIRVENGEALHLDYHNKRLNRSRTELFRSDDALDLKHYITPPDKELYRCRVLYDRGIRKIEYLPYHPKAIKRISLVESDIGYPYKYADRNLFHSLLAASPQSDEVLIVREGSLTDTTIANIAFLENGRWVTPDKPLLRGTTRERLVHEGFLMPKAIRKEEISNFHGFALMNAMIGFKIINPIWTGV